MFWQTCGFDLMQTTQEGRSLLLHPQWTSLAAVKTKQVYATDGNQYFNRPGSRLVDSLEILAEILHPACFKFGYEGSS
jgi:iron complex transport system substrate-binding protein